MKAGQRLADEGAGGRCKGDAEYEHRTGENRVREQDGEVADEVADGVRAEQAEGQLEERKECNGEH